MDTYFGVVTQPRSILFMIEIKLLVKSCLAVTGSSDQGSGVGTEVIPMVLVLNPLRIVTNPLVDWDGFGVSIWEGRKDD